MSGRRTATISADVASGCAVVGTGDAHGDRPVPLSVGVASDTFSPLRREDMASSSSKPRTRTTARMSVIMPVPDKDTIIKKLQASLAQERENKSEMVGDLNKLLATKQDLEEQREHLQADVQRFAHYYDKAEHELAATKELLAASQAEVAELKAQREQICFMAVQRHQQDAVIIQELQNSVHILTMQNEHLQNQVHHLEDAIMELEPEVQPVEQPMEDEAIGDGEILDD